MSKSDYAFDLDSFENHEEDYNEDTLYTVDAYHEGNWSRFVNHSCEPNIQVFPVCFDTIPENNAPYLAYTALKDIPARTELTLDYNPGATEIFARKKGKKSMKSLPEGIKECLCGAERCRGYVQFSY
ncbi:SET domain-containing protein [Dentipellis sp. KUC8613]|nr:SET domain-containing protein [Dentipellis sp. KUC8613]